MAFPQNPDQSQLEAFIIQNLSLTGIQGSADSGSTSALSGNDESSKLCDPPLSDEEILARYVESYRCKLSTYRPTISAVIDQPEFQPVSFLKLGLDRSSAVCRIARYFSRETLSRTLKDMHDNTQQRQNDFPNLHKSSTLNAAEELRVTFRMPDSLFEEIFPDSNPPRDMLDCINRLRKDENISRLLQFNPLPIGTGFLVGGSHLMTNHHVIPTAEVARQCVAQFNYEDLPHSTSVAEYEFAPDLLFVCNAQLDYTLVQLKPDKATRKTAGYQFGWLDLVETTEGMLPSLSSNQVDELIKKLLTYGYRKQELAAYGLPPKQGENLPGDRVVIIQHPRGRKKEIVLQDNGDVELTRNNLSYRADTDYGSSGSPVFNQRWELVALTKRVKPKLEPHSIDPTSNLPEFKIQWIASVGTRICRVIEDLKRQSINFPKLQSFIQDFVLTVEQLTCPPLPVALDLPIGSYVDCGNSGLDTPEAITLEVWVNKKSGYGKFIDRGGHYGVEWTSGNTIKITLFDGKKEICVTTWDSAPLSENRWYHLAFTWESGTGKLLLYINGILWNDTDQQEQELSIIPTSDVLYLGKAPTSESSDAMLHFDNFPQSEYSQQVLQVAITEVRLWNVARSPELIKSTYDCRLCGNERDLIGYWRFQEGEGRLIRNYAKPLPNPPTLSGEASTQNHLDQRFHGLAFHRDSYVDCGNSSKFELSTAMTIECWVRCREGKGVIINKGGAWEENGYSLFRYSDTYDPDNLRIELQNRDLADHGKKIYDIHLNGLSDEKWHHIAVTWDKKSKEIQVYFDSHKQDSDSPSLFSGPIGISLLPLNLGQTAKTSVNHELFAGDLAEVRLWNVARSSEEIRKFYNRPISDAEIEQFAGSLVGYWPLTEGRGDRATNLANLDLPGLIHKPQWLREEKDFDAAEGAYAIAHHSIWQIREFPILPLPSALVSTDGNYVKSSAEECLSTPGAFTVEAWVNHRFGNCLIVSRGKAGLENQFALSWSDNTIQVQLQDAKGTKKTIVKTTQPIPPDSLWHHVAFTWKPDNRELPSRGIAIFLDGRWQDCTVVNTKDHFDGNFDELQSELVIGDPRPIPPYRTYYSIAIAEVRLWKCSRTQDQLTANLSRQFIGTEPNLIGCWRLDSGRNSVFNQVSF